MTRRNGLLSTIALTIAGGIVAVMVVSCGILPSVVIAGQNAPRGVQTGIIVYLLDHGSLRAVNRPLPTTTATPDGVIDQIPFPNAQAALDSLVAGPTAADTAGGLTSDLPSNGVRAFILQAVQGQGYTYQVFVDKRDGQPLTQHAVDQIACTVSAAFVGTGNLPEYTSVQVQVLENKSEKRPVQACPATP